MAASDAFENSEQNHLLERLLDSMFDDSHKQYDVIGVIGKGGFGTVEKVLDKDTDTMVAMKTVPFDRDGGKANRDLKREIKTIAKLRCDVNIVRLLHVFRSNDKLHMVMELCDEDLAGYMTSQERLSDAARFNVARQVARGIDVLHSQNPPIVHRDIKPQNILIVRGDNADDVIVKIADFGISSSVVDFSLTNEHDRAILQTSAPKGTWPYMPPECYAALDGIGVKDGKFCYDASWDIFALGLVYLYTFFYDDNRYGKLMILIDTKFSKSCNSIHTASQ